MPSTFKKKVKNSHSLSIAVVFVVFVVFLICVALLLRVVTLFSKSSFTNSYQFTFAIYTNTPHVISVSPQTNTVAVLAIQGDNVVDGALGKLLKIPINGNARFKKHTESRFSGVKISQPRDVSNTLWQLLLSFSNLETKLTVLDMFRLWWFVNAVPSHNITLRSFTMPNTLESLDEFAVDKLSSQLFSDRQIIEEKISIQIVNGTGLYGVGNRLARLVSNMGGNVVLVSTSEKEIDSTEIVYASDKNYTAKKLASILNATLRKREEAKNKNTSSISDIIIYIGKDSLRLNVF